MRLSANLLLSMLMLLSGSVAAQNDKAMLFYTDEYPPFSFTLADDVGGINTELLKLALEHVHLKANFRVVPWGRAQRFTQAQANSCFFSAVRSDVRESMYQWVGPLSRERIVLYSIDPAGPKLESFKDASRYKVGGQSEDTYTAWVEDQGVAVERVTRVATNLKKLERKRMDLWLAGSIAGPYIAETQNLNVYPMVTSEDVFELWLACSLDLPKELIVRLNETLHTLQNDGTLDEIHQRYGLTR